MAVQQGQRIAGAWWKNNRFLYLTAVPEAEDFASYQQLHMAHITSSAFLPEHLKNGLQAVSSEGLIASFFYQMYRSADLKHSPAPAQVYHRFGCDADRLSPTANLYVKILWAMMQLDWCRETLFTDFVQNYLDAFEADRDILMDIFARVTNFVTVDPAAQQMFGEIYRVGRQGDMEKIVRLCKQAASQKKKSGLRSFKVGRVDWTMQSTRASGLKQTSPFGLFHGIQSIRPG